jgi:Tol biopolymer transport system component
VLLLPLAFSPAATSAGRNGRLLLTTCDDTVDSLNQVPYFRTMWPRSNERDFRTVHEFRDLRLDWCYIGKGMWSPDGRRILYDDLGSRVFVMRADGRRSHQILRQARYPSWSPNGRAVAFTRYEQPGNEAIFRAHANGSHVRRLTPWLGNENADLAWSPDGRTIAFARYLGTHYSIWLVGSNGGHLRKLVDDARRPAWSPDGRRIAYADELQRSISVISRLGRRRRRLTSVGQKYFWADLPVFSPDGRQIAFVRKARAWIMSATGRRVHPVSPWDAYVYGIDWRTGR